MDEECCPKFDCKPWDKKILEWNNKKFIKAKVKTFLHIPLNFGLVITKLDKKITEAGAKIQDAMALSEHTSKWNMNIYVAVDKDIPGLENVSISGNFLSKVYEGDFSKTGLWCEDFNQYAKDEDVVIKKMYMWYTTCPKCAKKYGKNYVVIIGEI